MYVTSSSWTSLLERIEEVFDFIFVPLSHVMPVESAGLEDSGFGGRLLVVAVFCSSLIQPWVSF